MFKRLESSMRATNSDGRSSIRTVKLIFYSPSAELIESEPFVQEMSYWTQMKRSLADKVNALNASYRTYTLEVDDIACLLTFNDTSAPTEDQDIVTYLDEDDNDEVYNQVARSATTITTSFSYERQDYLAPKNDENDDVAGGTIASRLTCGLSSCYGTSGLKVQNDEAVASNRPLDVARSRPRTSDDKNNNDRGRERQDLKKAPSFTPRYCNDVIKLGDSIVQWTENEKSYIRPSSCHVEIAFGDGCSFSIRHGGKLMKYKRKRYATSRKNIYTILDLKLTQSGYDAFLQYCEDMLVVITGFNDIGLLINFTAPHLVKTTFCSNGVSYYDETKAFCSEFIARALCHIGVFRHITTMQKRLNRDNLSDVNLQQRAEVKTNLSNSVPDTYSLCPTLSECVDKEAKIVYIDPGCTSPNDLFLYLHVKHRLYFMNGMSGFFSNSTNQFQRNKDGDDDDVFVDLSYGLLPTSTTKSSNRVSGTTTSVATSALMRTK